MGAHAASRTDVARLFARAAFGATAADLDTWTGLPYADMVDALLDAEAPIVDLDGIRGQLFAQNRSFGNEMEFDLGLLRQAQGWWLERMRTTPTPIAERMVLLWHGHFATARKTPWPDTGMLLQQHDLLRTHALGSFRDLALAITLDPAMLWWLDGAVSAHPNPNENFGRELFELFTLGKSPQRYTETDIREAARGLTGWTAEPYTREVSFDPLRHDPGTKQVLGRRIPNLGADEYESVVQAALDQPVSTRFIANKLVRELAYDPGKTDLLRNPDPLVVRVADVLARTGWDIKAAVRTLLLSEEFRDQRRRRARQPVEMVVHAARVFAIGADDNAFVLALSAMGQELFHPANVGGWPYGASWYSPASTLARYTAAVRVWELIVGFSFQTLPAATDLAGWAALLGLASLSAPTTRAVRSYLATTAKDAEQARQSGVLVLLLTSPDWAVI